MYVERLDDFYRPQAKLREGNVFTGVCDSVHGGGAGACFRGGVPGPRGGYGPGGGGPGGDPPDGYCYGRYASYWNAFLLILDFFCTSIEIWSILLSRYKHGMYTRFPSTTSIKSSAVTSSRSVTSALWILYSPRIVFTKSKSSSDCAT